MGWFILGFLFGPLISRASPKVCDFFLGKPFVPTDFISLSLGKPKLFSTSQLSAFICSSKKKKKAKRLHLLE
jgi:hypothetical protein